MKSQIKPSDESDLEPQSEAQGGYEKSAERDAQSNQSPGKLPRELEIKIGENMPDRK